MSEYSDYGMIEQKLREGMYVGNRHKCRRDVGRIAGGCLASGRISEEESVALRKLALSLSSDGERLGAREWDEAVAYGCRQPLEKSAPVPTGTSHAVGWDEVVNPDDYRIVDRNWLEHETVAAPSEWNPCRELSEYLSALFRPEEHVAYLTNPPNIGGEYRCVGGVWSKTVAEIQKSLAKGTDDGFAEAVGTPNPESGAWIVVNPVDGQGRKDANIVAFRHALIECDTIPVNEQVAIYRKLELPCSVIVHSGGKSAHAIVRIDAADISEYRKRVDFLFTVCEQNGLAFDKQNRNPSRFTRMPGFIRGEGKQYIISRACGKKSWEEWESWIKEQNDSLPDFETLTEAEIENPPAPLPELVEGILSISSKMIIAGPSKAGKSFLLIELAIAIAEGGLWVGRRCRQGRVLYVNLELHKDSCTRRFSAVYKALFPTGRHVSFIDRWNLRGCAEPMDTLAPKLIRRAKDRGYALIIVDPIYKVLTGDENNARDMAEFMRYFDRIAYECGCAVAFCHHHSKGFQGDKNSLDRASGSGVFVRDTDALIDMTQLDAENARAQLQNRYECEAMLEVARRVAIDTSWEQGVSADDKLVANRLAGILPAFFSAEDMSDILAARDAAAKRCESITAWRLSYTLRDFATPKPLGTWFLHPYHMLDEEDLLTDATPQGAPVPKWQAAKNAKKAASEKPDKARTMVNLVKFDPKRSWTTSELASQLGVSQRRIQQYCKTLGWTIEKGTVVPKEENDDECPPF